MKDMSLLKIGTLAALAVLLVLGGAMGAASAQDKDPLAPLAAIAEAWLAAPHGNHHSPSFTYWNKEGAVPVACATCHSQPGFVDFLGADGSAPGVVDKPAAINSPIGCPACHTGAAHALDSVTFPSGAVLDGLGSSAVCTVCHQGRQSGRAVDEALAGLAEDAVDPKLAFVNVHYGIAAAVLGGADTAVGYAYPGKRYSGRFQHVARVSSCTDCHDPHTTVAATQSCLACHRGVDDIRAIRTRHGDFDGDGDTTGGIRAEIAGLHDRLYAAIRTYAETQTGQAIAYAPGRYPYFFIDGDGDGAIAEQEAVMANRYASWTPRLLKAAYNYQVAAKDSGGYVHNPTYLLQLLHDSLESLSERVDIDMAGIRRP